jgi:dihydrofolate synthase / folylpolyglutamate synthase
MTKNLKNWLSYLESLSSGLESAAGLEPVRAVAEHLQILHFSCPVVSITGTNGKGSTVAFLEAIYLAAGYKVAAYTSPHLLQYNERIRINGENINDAALLEAFSCVENARLAAQVDLSFFAFSTLAALYLFKRAPLDVLILEIGLGGRLDPVNIIDSDVAVITSISLDHTQYLGTDREAIGLEKAGIMRALKPVVYGDPHPPQSVLQTAKTLSAPLYLVAKDFNYLAGDTSFTWQSRTQTLNNLPLPQLPLANAATALMVVELLKATLPVKLDALQLGLKNAFLLGRWQRLHLPREVIIDVAHNPGAAELLAQRLQAEPRTGKVRAVFSMLQDKDIGATVKPLLSLIDVWYVAAVSSKRAASVELLMQTLDALFVKNVYNCQKVSTALEKALAESEPGDTIIVFGSFYAVAEVLKWQEEKNKNNFTLLD